MRRKLWLTWAALVTGTALLVLGCGWAKESRRYPPDPLLLSKRPVEAKPSSAAALVARRELEAPDFLDTALASREPAKSSVPAVPASRVTEK